MRLRILLIFAFFVTGCSQNYFFKDEVPQDETGIELRRQNVDGALQKIKPGEFLSLRLYSDEVFEGTLYSYQDGIVSIRIEESFRDFETKDIAGVKIGGRASDIKIVAGILIFITMVFIVYKFSTK